MSLLDLFGIRPTVDANSFVIGKVDEAVSQLNKAVEELRAENKNLIDRMGERSTMFAKLEMTLTQLHKSVESMRSDIATNNTAMKSEVDKLEKRIETLEHDAANETDSEKLRDFVARLEVIEKDVAAIKLAAAEARGGVKVAGWVGKTAGAGAFAALGAAVKYTFDHLTK
ncbi:hypothetical protein [Methylosinus sp. PW1]|uniref:hypothetical protein n=1 Tax=Methylosinus sp. PW1 TaxID=107636 RepID=UPI00055A434D|nr:hypothetical protein [Methylosinus sp. PW1]